MNSETRLPELGLQLPSSPKPAGNCQPWRIAGHLLFLPGPFSIENGQFRQKRQVGADLSETDGYDAARLPLHLPIELVVTTVIRRPFKPWH